MDNPTISPKTSGPSSPAPPSPSKTQTCPFWATGTCSKTATSCSHAHHLFPKLVYRSAKNSDEDTRCPEGGACFWPTENCAYLHDEAPGFDPRDSTNFRHDREARRKQVQALEDGQGWKAKTKFYCKRDGCTTPGFLEFEELLEHQRKYCPLKGKDGTPTSRAAVALADAQAAEQHAEEAPELRVQAMKAAEEQAAHVAETGAAEALASRQEPQSLRRSQD